MHQEEKYNINEYEKKSAMGVFKEDANTDLVQKEKEAWGEVTKDKYGNS